ncbi:putative molybdenum carrier protein [Malikia spinosa]|jgi:hypothetical protein|uniref:Molybdenum cofactor carrier n=1 Tax=Malikia spinosa TaxID=86180 RepID=A0A7C9N8Q9_9BURK|nr:putative molybdenum carrier protein [Malikia spinosa]MYZ52382.1 molybdenum cofactor carrier [Malikia spinosa]
MTGIKHWLIERIVSGGQTGADRAALDWAHRHGVPHGGWCPKGRLAADGPLPAHYPLQETESAGYRQRTKLNVRDSDATLILNRGPLDGGTLQTLRFARMLGKPHLVIQLDELTLDEAVKQVRAWLSEGRFSALNVAGPREEKRPGIHASVRALLDACFLGGCDTR